MSFIDKISKTYLSLFFDNSSIKSKDRIIFESSSIKTLDEFYKKIIKIKNDDKFDDILSEAVEEVKYGQKLISKIENGPEVQIFNSNQIIKNINENWKYFNLLNKFIPTIFVYKFNFNDFSIMKKIVLKHFQQFKDEFSKKDAEKTFHDNCSSLNGFMINTFEFSVMFLNTNETFKYNKITINHELTHYFQDAIHVNEDNIEFNKFLDLNSLFLSIEKQKYVFSNKEIKPHILVDFISQLKKLFYLKYSEQFSKEEFLDILFKTIEANPLNIYRTSFGNSYIENFKNILPLSMVCASKYYNLKYDYIKNKCYEDIIK